MSLSEEVVERRRQGSARGSGFIWNMYSKLDNDGEIDGHFDFWLIIMFSEISNGLQLMVCVELRWIWMKETKRW